MDPPINQNGIAQATNLGRALGRRRQSQQQQQKSDELLFFSSSLLRAKMTAELAAAAAAASTSTSAMTITNSVRELASLAEIDFGPMTEGQPISKVKQSMEISYTKWSMGNVDYRPDGGGDNGREVRYLFAFCFKFCIIIMINLIMIHSFHRSQRIMHTHTHIHTALPNSIRPSYSVCVHTFFVSPF